MDTKTLIKRLGGTAKTAELCEVTPGAVSQWRKSGIPKARLMFIRLARPEIFGTATLRRRKANKPPEPEPQPQ